MDAGPTHMTLQREIERLHQDLGLKRLNSTWAKLEILGGLATAGAGLVFLCDGKGGVPTVQVGGLLLFVFGGYLAMAGHRRHLYQSNNLLAAWVAHAVRERSVCATPPREPS